VGSDLRNHVGRQLPGEAPAPQRVELAAGPAVACDGGCGGQDGQADGAACVRSGGSENPS